LFERLLFNRQFPVGNGGNFTEFSIKPIAGGTNAAIWIILL